MCLFLSLTWEGIGESRSDRPLDLNLTMQPCLLLLLLPFPFLPLPLLSPAARPSVRPPPPPFTWTLCHVTFSLARTTKRKAEEKGHLPFFLFLDAITHRRTVKKASYVRSLSLSLTQQRSNTLPRTRKPNDTKKRQQRAFLTNIFLIYFSFSLCKQSWWAFTLHRDGRSSEYAKEERQKDTISFRSPPSPSTFSALEKPREKDPLKREGRKEAGKFLFLSYTA